MADSDLAGKADYVDDWSDKSHVLYKVLYAGTQHGQLFLS